MKDLDTYTEWGVRIHCTIAGQPGPHTLYSTTEQSARARLDWWTKHRPEVQPELLRRPVALLRGPWQTITESETYAQAGERPRIRHHIPLRSAK